MSTITSMGVGSGIDVRGLVDQLVAAERAPRENRINSQEKRIEEQISGLGKLKSGLSDFGAALDGLSSAGDFRQVETRVVKEGMVTANARDNAPIGNYEVEVTQLAQSQRLATSVDLFGDVADFSAGGTALGAGDVTITLADGTTETFTLTEEASTLEDLRAAINNQSSSLRASVVDDGNGPRLTLSTTQTGEQNAISQIAVNAGGEALLNKLGFNAADLGVDQDTSGGFRQLRAAQDAIVKVDGLEVTRPTNELRGVLDGVDLTLNDTGTTRVAVTEQEGTALEAVRGFVEAYNALRSQLNALNAFNPDTEESGILNGDSTLRGVQDRMARMVSNPVEGMDGAVRALADLGISTQRDGTLAINEARLSDRLAEDREAVVSLFTQADTGIAARMKGVVEEFTGRDSIINTRTENLRQQMSGLADDRERLEYRMERIEARYIAQFSAMDAMVAQMNQTSQFLDNQLQALPGNNRK
ncbi:flagellar filament capping protein FliD [Ectothiorhodospira variabilis]|uniref:flagellar filament capping protein FliD n=1 Tax=Ectothiorhodospira variabilis TaxID=505694 RepID=UPI001EFA2EF1